MSKRARRWALVAGVASMLAGVAGCGDKQKKGTTPNVGKKSQAQKQGGPPAIPGTEDDKKPAAAPANAAGSPAATPEAQPPPTRQVGAQPVGIVRRARGLIRSGRFQQAIQESKKALRRNEKYAPAMVTMARAYYGLGKYEFAESICAIALGINKQLGECYSLSGHVALKREESAQALANFKKATEADANYGPGWLNYGAMLLKVKNYGLAVSVLERAAQLLSNRPEVQLNLGAAYRGNGQLLRARQTFNKALKLRGNYPKALFNIGLLYLDATKVFDGRQRMQQLQEAVSYLTRYKATGAYSKSGDPVDAYIDSANKLIRREQRKLKRAARRAARAAAKKAAPKKKPAPAPKK